MRRGARLRALAGILAGGVLAPAAVGAGTPETPRVGVDTTYPTVSGRTVTVSAGGDLQRALDSAQGGDAIVLEAGATFSGPFTLPRKEGNAWIIVRSSAAETSLPPPGRRVTPAHGQFMPKLVAPWGSLALRAAPGAHHFWFVGIEFRPAAGAFVYNLILLGLQETEEHALPHHIVFDRSYIHGDPLKGGRRGIAMNSRWTAVVDSYLADFKEVGADSQAIAGWNGSGPFKLVNNYLEAAGENVMFGGAEVLVPGLVPADIEIRGNHFSKPLSWRAGDPAYGGTRWTVKNLLELKMGQRVLIDGNVFENSWADAQVGFAVQLTPRNTRGLNPWAVVEDITFTNNLFRRTAAGINVLGFDDARPSRQTRRILLRNNMFEIQGPRWGGDGKLFQFLSGTADVVIEHNTALNSGNILTAEGKPHTEFVYRNNITVHNAYGVIGSGSGVGRPTLTRYFPGAEFARNVIVGGPPSLYPADNFFPSSLDRVGFVNFATGDYRLTTSSPYRARGTDGKDIGADVDLARLLLVTSQLRIDPSSSPPRTATGRVGQFKTVGGASVVVDKLTVAIPVRSPSLVFSTRPTDR